MSFLVTLKAYSLQHETIAEIKFLTGIIQGFCQFF